MNWTIRAFLYLPYAVFLVNVFAFVRTCGLRVRTQAIWAMALLACCSKFVCFEYFGGNAFNPDFPEKFMWLWGWAYSGSIILAFFSVPLCWWHARTKAWLLPLVAWTISAVGLWSGVKPPDVHEVEVVCADLPAELDGYRIAQLSDLHVSTAALGWRTRAVVARTNALGADLICLTGDYVDGKPEKLLPELEPIRELKARDGVWAVTGNHECFRSHWGWREWYARWGIRFLENECVFPHAGLALGGVNDFRVLDPKTGVLNGEYPDVGKAFASATNGEFRVLLQHQPRAAHANVEGHGVRLQLSGHTHGGIMPLLAEFVRRRNGGFVRGLYELAGGKLYVNPGCGQWAGFPMRFFDPSEIALITLRRGGF